ncbi:hypothetical protein AVEN_24499-1 [Araneus ventricosus]|uniref:Uncharacterized protein n=1 Tax=Araneus ventricosus TaxID=182803 RepID=A0A4Y2L057_ARAVE|nr:hypothetical protein AVEN_24499-1 [Araneus ventricosus]
MKTRVLWSDTKWPSLVDASASPVEVACLRLQSSCEGNFKQPSATATEPSSPGNEYCPTSSRNAKGVFVNGLIQLAAKAFVMQIEERKYRMFQRLQLKMCTKARYNNVVFIF